MLFIVWIWIYWIGGSVDALKIFTIKISDMYRAKTQQWIIKLEMGCNQPIKKWYINFVLFSFYTTLFLWLSTEWMTIIKTLYKLFKNNLFKPYYKSYRCYDTAVKKTAILNHLLKLHYIYATPFYSLLIDLWFMF